MKSWWPCDRRAPRRVVVATKMGTRFATDRGEPRQPRALGSRENVRRSIEGSFEPSWAPITSTSTTCTGSIRARRSRRRSARWPSSSRRARSATSASARRHPRPPQGARHPSDHRAADRVLVVDARPRGRRPAPPAASWASASSPTRRSAVASSAAASARRRILDPGDFRRFVPRLTGEPLEQNVTLAAGARDRRRARTARPANWRSRGCSPRATTSSRYRGPSAAPAILLEENLGALDVELSDDDLARIDAELPAAAGDRYDAASMATVNR